MQKKSIIAIGAVIGLIIFSSIFISRQTPRPLDTLVVGMMSGWAPFMTINNYGDYVGFDVDIAKALATRMGKKLIIKDMGSLASLFVSLEQKKIDMAFSGLDITQSRLAKLAMVPYTGEAVKSFSLLFWHKVPSTITKIEDFKNVPDAVICAEPGSAQEKYLNQFSFITKKPLAAVSDMILDLRYGKSLAAILEPQVARSLQKKESAIQILSVPLPKEFVVYGMGVALKKDNTELITAITTTMQELKNDGSLKKLEQQWGLEK